VKVLPSYDQARGYTAAAVASFTRPPTRPPLPVGLSNSLTRLTVQRRFFTGTRGTTANVVVMEEAGFIPNEVVKFVVIPLMGVKHTVTLAISTPSDKDTYFATLFNMTYPDTGERVFKCIPIGLACEDCRKRNITVKCMHMIYNLPSWKDLSGHELQVRMLSEDAARQETFAEQLSARIPCFPHYLIDALWARGEKNVTGRDGTIFIGVDPSRGGTGRSSTAMVAILYDRHDHVVVSLTTHTHALSQHSIRARARALH
jgi:hypothetical protein